MSKYCFFFCFFFFEFVFPQNTVWLGINSQDPVHFVVTDQWNRKTGKDVKNNINYNAIPNANYSLESISDDVWAVDFSMPLTVPSENGSFNVQFTGDTLLAFDIYFSTVPENSTNAKFNINIKTFLDIDSSLNYRVSYVNSSVNDSKIEKLITIKSLLQDISTAGKLNMVGNQSFLNGLLTKMGQIINFYNANNKSQAHNKLNELKLSIQSAYFSPTASQFVSEYAYLVFIEDISLTFDLIGYTGPIEEMKIKK